MYPHRGGYWHDWLYTLNLWWDNWPEVVVVMALVPVVAAVLGWMAWSWGWKDWQAARAAKVRGFDVTPKR